MKIGHQFSKYALEYQTLSTIQNAVAQKLLSLVRGEPKKILDLGCGSGALCEKISWEYELLCGIDFADGMLSLHPKSKNIELINADFNKRALFDDLRQNRYDYILSSSALQWAKEIDETLKNIASLKAPVALAIFTSNTFATLNKTASLESMLCSADELESLGQKYFDADFEVVSYRLEFESVREMFRYIKRSGVSGARNVLSVTETKRLMREYPLSYLEFEVAFISS